MERTIRVEGTELLFLFQYNWQVRNEWFNWCDSLTEEELLRQQTGGVGSFLQTLFHIVDAECSYIREMNGQSDLQPKYEDYMSLARIRALSELYHIEVVNYLGEWRAEMDQEAVRIAWFEHEELTKGEVLRHTLTHEIHHIGQLSVWAKQLGKSAVSANYIGRGLK
jgi:uncharacterized damage-inducible protein DinB